MTLGSQDVMALIMGDPPVRLTVVRVSLRGISDNLGVFRIWVTNTVFKTL